MGGTNFLLSTTTSCASYAKTAQDNYMATNNYQEELLAQWWNRWKVVGLPHMIPYQRYKDAKCHKNLVKWDVCHLQYNGKFKHTYRLCIILETFPSEGSLVRTVKVGFRPKKQCKASPYKSVSLDELVVGVPCLFLIMPAEELPETHNSHVLKLSPHSNPSFNPGERGEGCRETAKQLEALQASLPSLSGGEWARSRARPSSWSVSHPSSWWWLTTTSFNSGKVGSSWGPCLLCSAASSTLLRLLRRLHLWWLRCPSHSSIIASSFWSWPGTSLLAVRWYRSLWGQNSMPFSSKVQQWCCLSQILTHCIALSDDRLTFVLIVSMVLVWPELLAHFGQGPTDDVAHYQLWHTDHVPGLVGWQAVLNLHLVFAYFKLF